MIKRSKFSEERRPGARLGVIEAVVLVGGGLLLDRLRHRFRGGDVLGGGDLTRMLRRIKA